MRGDRGGIGVVLISFALLAACGQDATPVRTVEPPVGRPGLPTPDQVVAAITGSTEVTTGKDA